MMKKKGIELSVNFLVTLIIAVVVFGIGIYLAHMLFGKAIEKQNEIDAKTKEQIISLLNSGEKIVIPGATKTIEKGDSDVFGLGVLNVDNTNTVFYINIEIGDAFDESGNLISDVKYKLVKEDILFRLKLEPDLEPVTIPPNKEEVFSIGVKVPKDAGAGTHILNVYICLDGANDYDSTMACGSNLEPNQLYDNAVHKIQVIVP